MVAMTNKTVEINIDDTVDNSPNNWFEFQAAFDLVPEGVYNNDDADDAFVCMTCTGDPFDKQYNKMVFFYTPVYWVTPMLCLVSIQTSLMILSMIAVVNHTPMTIPFPILRY